VIDVKKKVVAAVNAISALLFAWMFLVFIVEVFFRYVLDSPLSWSVEMIQATFLLMLFWTLTFNVSLKRHVAFTVVRDLVPPQAKRVFAVVANVVCAAILVPSFPAILSLAAYEQRESTPILHIPLSVTYGSFAMFVAAFTLRLLLSAAALFRPGWREYVTGDAKG
jgi:TRAP-type C4-dicarboxylate transport system permease small subunit